MDTSATVPWIPPLSPSAWKTSFFAAVMRDMSPGMTTSSPSTKFCRLVKGGGSNRGCGLGYATGSPKGRRCLLKSVFRGTAGAAMAFSILDEGTFLRKGHNQTLRGIEPSDAMVTHHEARRRVLGEARPTWQAGKDRHKGDSSMRITITRSALAALVVTMGVFVYGGAKTVASLVSPGPLDAAEEARAAKPADDPRRMQIKALDEQIRSLREQYKSQTAPLEA